jgi:small-conductance mechanosensitive channel
LPGNTSDLGASSPRIRPSAPQTQYDSAMNVCRIGSLAILGACLSSVCTADEAVKLAAPPTAAAAAPAPATATTPTPAPAPTQTPAAAARVSVLTGDQVIQILDQTVEWYRTLGTQQQSASQPSDLLILYANQQTAAQVVALAFDIARANAELLSSEASSTSSAGDSTSSSQALVAQQKKLQAQRLSIQSEMDGVRRQIAASGGSKPDLSSKLSELQGELDMLDARSNLLNTMTQFVNENDSKSSSANALKSHIDAIAVSVPLTGTAAAPAPPPATPTAAPATGKAPAAAPPTVFANGASASTRTGIWELASNVFKLSDKVSTIKAIDRNTAALEETFTKIRSAPLQQLKALSARSDTLAAQADSAQGAALKDVRNQLDTLAWLFKQTSDILIPLSKEGVLLQQYRHNLNSWRDAVKRQYREALAALGVRLGILLAMLAVVFGGAEVWRRLVIRYTHDPRRRYQQQLVRKITMWTLAVAVVGFSFVTELSSFATFAGLITAGLAVAMQSVLVSIVGYFFLIGKYGVRVGDRVQIGNVSGEVIDLGLVRMHLMELSPQGPLGATGRVVAYANSIVFQPTGGLFKQIPGVNFAWHETTWKLPAGCDYVAIKEKLLAAVVDVVKDYHEEIVRQTKQIETTTASSSVGGAQPQVQLHFSAAGVEALVRYPVQLQHEAEIDERVSKEVMKVISAGAPAEQSSTQVPS